MNKPIFLFLLILLIGCSPKSDQHSITISGNSQALIGKMIYLKDYDHFNYLNEKYNLDSCQVDEKGNFTFQLSTTIAKLVTLSEHRTPPPSYQVFRNNPELYTYSFCANFFALTPTLFIEPGQSYEILQWDLNNDDASILFKNEPLNTMRTYYRKNDYLKNISNASDGTPINIEPSSAWETVKKQRDSLLSHLNIDLNVANNPFKDYLKTEIQLGAVNEFIKWYNYQDFYEKDEIFYDQLIEIYHQETWNSLSIEYFKLTERYISHQMNKGEHKELMYHQPSQKKIEYSQKYAGANIRAQYVSNLRKLKGDNDEQ